MTSTYFLAIGGSGCKTLEAFIHLCAAGLGPDEAWVGLVDQDAVNGHVKFVGQLLKNYMETRERLRTAGNDMLGKKTNLFRTRLVTAENGFLWQPLSKGGATLETNIVNKPLLDEPQKRLLNCLFSPEEQTVPLNVGFRGHPSLGAATIAHAETMAIKEAKGATATLGGNSRYWTDLSGQIKDAATSGQDVRVFFAGSICGGTGAAGFPTLSRMLRKDLKRLTVKLGGALLLPYFTFPSGDGTDGLAADSAVFQEQAAGALDYYYHLMGTEQPFSNLYLIGWSPMIAMRDRSIGGEKQRNPPLAPELYAALAASRFMCSPVPPEPIQYIGRDFDDAMSWTDLPAVDSSAPADQTRLQLGQLLRFAHAFNTVYGPNLTASTWKKVKGEAWFKTLLPKPAVDLGDGSVQKDISSLLEYCQDLLMYFADMTYAMGDANSHLNLVLAHQFANAIKEVPWKWSELKKPAAIMYEEKGKPEPFSKMIVAPDERLSANFKDLYQKLSGIAAAGDRRSIGIFIGALYDACALN